MLIGKSYLKSLCLNDLKALNGVCHFADCVIDQVELIGVFDIDVPIKMERCIINELKIHSCWFNEGIALKNCIINGYIDYQMGGHNKKPILLYQNVFTGFVNFFDCQFDSRVEIVENVFVRGANLFGNLNEGFANTFESELIVSKNIGDLDLDGFGFD